MSGILVFSHHGWPAKPGPFFERIQTSLPRVAQLVTGTQVTTFFSENTSIWGYTTRAPTLPTVI